jgi:hypothetical protein
MTPAALLAALQAEGVRLTALGDGRLSLTPTPRPDLLALAIAAKPALLRLLAAEAPPVPAAAPPAKRHQPPDDAPPAEPPAELVQRFCETNPIR